MTDYDAVIIGSGAGGGAVAWRLARAGKRVLVLEKGPWFSEADYFKDELACCRRSVYTPDLREERHVIEEAAGKGWSATSTHESGWDFWNGNVVGGSSNFMSGFFHRLKPVDFRLRSEFGHIPGANVVDWPIAYEDLEPYYTEVESVVGVSGRVVPHPFLEPRSTPDPAQGTSPNGHGRYRSPVHSRTSVPVRDGTGPSRAERTRCSREALRGRARRTDCKTCSHPKRGRHRQRSSWDCD